MLATQPCPDYISENKIVHLDNGVHSLTRTIKLSKFINFDSFFELNKKLEKELEVIEDNKKQFYKKLFSKLTLNLLLLQPQKIAFEITFDDSLSYKMLFNDVIVFFEAYIQVEDPKEEIIYSTYKSSDKSFIKSYFGSIEDALNQIKYDLSNSYSTK